MRLNKEVALKRLDQLLAATENFFLKEGQMNIELIDETTFGAIAFVDLLYHEEHEFINQIKDSRDAYIQSTRESYLGYALMWTLKGILNTIKYELENDLIGSIETQAKGEILGDFISLAKSLLGEGYKDSAAVLACGALEDSLKKYAQNNGLDVEEKDLSTVIAALKSNGFIKGAQAGVVQSYVQLRNKAFHAQFDKIEPPEVASLISFVEQFLLSNF